MKREMPVEYEFCRTIAKSAFRSLREEGKWERVEQLKELTKVYDLSMEDIYGSGFSGVQNASRSSP